MSKSPTSSTGRRRSPPPPEKPSTPSQPNPPPDPAVGELVAALHRRRQFRELKLVLISALADAKAEFSFLRSRGLKGLLKFLKSAVVSDDSVLLFRHSQTISELQVVPVLFQHTLQQQRGNPAFDFHNILGAQPMKITSPATESEIAIALRVLEGCCLLYNGCAALAHKHKAVKVLTNILSTRGTTEQGPCLDALISLMLDSSANQADFGECHATEKVIELIKDDHADEKIRLKCGEFLLLLIGHVNRSENSPLANIHDEIRRSLGEKCASLIWAASQFGSTLDPDQRQTALQIQARRVIESLEL